LQRDVLLAEARAALGDHARPWIGRELSVLDRALAGDGWLVDARFSVVVLNVAGVLSPSRSAQLDLSVAPRVREWLSRCYARPAAIAVRERFAEFVDSPTRP
jgi:glutathione S-transferase